MATALKLYHRLPPWLGSVAASLWGYRLRRVRYGADTERLVEEALERDRWSEDQWRRWREPRLGEILRRAATAVPYYRRRRPEGDEAVHELEQWPVLDKEAVRAEPRTFLADQSSPDRMIHDSTSGTTGTSLDLWFRPETVRRWYALFEARCRRWYGVSRHDRWGIIGGQLIVPVRRRRPPFWVWNAGLNQLYLSAYHLSPELIAHYLAAIRRYRVRYLLGYTSALHALAAEILHRRGAKLDLAVVVTNAEPLYEHQREAMAAAFGCPVRETYGMAELVAAASECESGSLHLWPEVGVLEVLEAGRPVPPGSVGEFVCTGLLNEDMPLIRYRVG
ncbi:MAG: phenylacetate--CoA ligase family protein, partial [Candidatus Binatia bacterium]